MILCILEVQVSIDMDVFNLVFWGFWLASCSLVWLPLGWALNP